MLLSHCQLTPISICKKRIPHKMFCFCLMLLLDVSCVFMVAKQQSEDRICFISRHRNKYSRNINKKQLLLWHMPISNNSANMRPYLFLRYELNLREKNLKWFVCQTNWLVCIFEYPNSFPLNVGLLICCLKAVLAYF